MWSSTPTSSPRRSRAAPVLHQLLPPARGLHRGYIRGAGHPGRSPDALYLRHGVPRLPRREAAELGGGGEPCAQDSGEHKLPYYTLSPTYSVCKNHGYLNGEQFTCPECGESAEVYSRITGYYRPVQNWNAGKTQEYKERREYNIDHSVLRHDGPLHEDAPPPRQSRRSPLTRRTAAPSSSRRPPAPTAASPARTSTRRASSMKSSWRRSTRSWR